MNTIFVTCFHGLISRNILSTRIPELLAKQGFRLVVIVPEYKRAYFEETFSSPNMLIEGILQNQPTRHRRGLFFKRLTGHMLGTNTVRIQQRYKYVVEGKVWFYWMFIVPARLLGRFRMTRNVVRVLDNYVSPHGFFVDLLDRHHPDLIFSTDIQNENDVALVQDARSRGIPVIGMVRSWDNITQFATRILPDVLLAANEAMRSEAERFADMPRGRTVVVGIPHYDHYLEKPALSRETFFRTHHFDLAKKLIFYAPIGDFYIPGNTVDRMVLEFLATLDVNVFVRFPPNDVVQELGGFTLPTNMFFDRPGVQFRSRGPEAAEVSREDDDRLAEAIAQSDLVIAGPSTICIDGCFFQKPNIMVFFDPGRETLPYIRSLRRYQHYHHLARYIASGAVRIAETPEELKRSVKRYLDHPEYERGAREAFRSSYNGGSVDGSAAMKAADAILQALERKK